MECERLQRLVKSWYAQVQEESMAPARMVSFMNTHIAECAICLADPMVRQEIEKITAIVLPPSKIRKTSSSEEEELEYEEEGEAASDEEAQDEEEGEDEDGDDEGEEIEDEEIEEDDLDDEDI